jgi:hypothetical protein
VPQCIPQSAAGWDRPAPIWALALPVLALLSVAASLNLYVNPLRLYWSQRFDPARMSYRAERLKLVKSLPKPPATIILGSSRVMTMRASDVARYLPGPCFNCTGVGAMAEDYYAGLRLIREDAHAPVRDVVLGIDLEAFCPNVPTIAEARYFPEYRRYLIRSPRAAPGPGEALSLLVSMQQLNESWSVLRRSFSGRGPTLSIGPGGEALQPARDADIAAGRFNLGRVLDRRCRKYALQSLHLAAYAKPDPVRLQYMEDLLDYCQEHGIRLHAYITPYHPRLWDVFKPLKGIDVLGRTLAELSRRFKARGLELRDFSHIECFGGNPDWFFDEVHMTPDNQALLLRALLAGPAPDRREAAPGAARIGAAP